MGRNDKGNHNIRREHHATIQKSTPDGNFVVLTVTSDEDISRVELATPNKDAGTAIDDFTFSEEEADDDDEEDDD